MTETADPPTQTTENPLAEGLALRRTPDPCALVMFGADRDARHAAVDGAEDGGERDIGRVATGADADEAHPR